MAKLTDNGLEFDKLDAVLSKLQDLAREKFADLLESGDDFPLDESSVLGRILGISAEPDALNEELIFDVWSSFDPEQAEGIYLEKLVRTFAGMERKPSTPALAFLRLRGTVGVTVPAGSYVSSSKTGDKFITYADVEFDPDVANGVVLDINTLTSGTSYTLSYKAATGLNVYPPIGIIAGDGETKETLANRFAETVNAISSVLEAFVGSDNLVHVRFQNANLTGYFSSTATMDIVQSYNVMSSYAATFSAIRQVAGSLNVIQSSTLGWLEVTNPFDSIESEAAESDKDLRERFKLDKGKDSTGSRQAMYADLYALAGVRFVNIQENVQDVPLEGRTSKGISVVVFGGDEDSIAQTIANNRPCGCYTDGDIEKNIVDINNSTYTVRFSRPELVPIQIKLSLSTDSTFPADGSVRIQDVLVNYFEGLNVGDDILISRLYTPINTIQGQSIDSLQVSVKGQPLGNENIEIRYNQLAVISYEDINF